jgi:organic radical activating enzyme
MFGKNEIVGQRYFKDAAKDQLYVTSMFMTLQGEGPFRGEPAFFIRLAKCNLACSFCDTYFDSGDWLDRDQIDARINQTVSDFYAGDVPHWAKGGWTPAIEDITYPHKVAKGEQYFKKRKMVLVLTGGEPMLQANIVPFLEYMNLQFEHTQIESNGTIHQDLPRETVLVVSPKCSEKAGRPVKYLAPRESVLLQADCLKFVMSADADSPYSSIPEWAHEWHARTGKAVFISPMNIYNSEPKRSKEMRVGDNSVTIEQRSTVDEIISFWEEGLLNMPENQKNHEYAAKYCMRHGFVLNLQIHLYASLA